MDAKTPQRAFGEEKKQKVKEIEMDMIEDGKEDLQRDRV